MSKKNELKNLCNDPTVTISKKPTFKTVCKNWIEHKKITCTPYTLKNYQSKLKQYFLKAPFADRLIDAIQREEIEQWVYELRKTCTEKCIYSTLGIMKNIFNYAIKMEWTEKNTAITFRLPKPNVKLPEPFKKEEVEAILENIDPFYYDYQVVMFFAGMRIGEINSLSPSDIDLENGTIWIGRSSLNGQSHNFKNCRTHVMNDRVFKAVSRQLEKAKRQGSIALFFNKQGKPINSNYYRRAVWMPLFNKKRIRDSNIRYRSMLNCRHTFASIMLLAGEGIALIARQMGHHYKNFGVWSTIKPGFIHQNLV